MRISDWSSDVCSSDLDSLSPKIRPCLARAGSPKHYASGSGRRQALELSAYIFGRWILRTHLMKQRTGSAASEGRHRGGISKAHDLHFRSEESRLGKECVSTFRSRWSHCLIKNK